MPSHEEFAPSPLDNLSDAEVDQLLNRIAQMKGKSGKFSTTRPVREKEVDLTPFLGGLE